MRERAKRASAQKRVFSFLGYTTITSNCALYQFAEEYNIYVGEISLHLSLLPEHLWN